jgi:hypothetical protein
MARKPQALTFMEAASAPIAAVTTWQMLFDYAQVTTGQTVLIHGAAGNVGAYAVQMARQAGLHVVIYPLKYPLWRWPLRGIFSHSAVEQPLSPVAEGCCMYKIHIMHAYGFDVRS